MNIVIFKNSYYFVIIICKDVNNWVIGVNIDINFYVNSVGRFIVNSKRN